VQNTDRQRLKVSLPEISWQKFLDKKLERLIKKRLTPQ
jgi:hypothetical protein